MHLRNYWHMKKTRPIARRVPGKRRAVRLITRLGIALAAITVASASSGTGTDPTLAIWRATSAVGDTSRTVRLEGEFPADDLVQLAYPMQILIHSTGPSAIYVRFDLSAGAVTGVAPELADGLDAGEAVALLTQGTPSADARVVFIGPGRIDVLLPAAFPTGPAEAQFFVLDGVDPILSNPLPFELGGSGS